MLNKALLISIIFIPLFIPEPFQIPIIFLLLIMGYIVNGVSNLAINSWFISIVTEEIRGRYFAVRQILCVVLSVVLPIATGYMVDQIKDKYYGFLILYCIAIVIGFIENYYFSKVQDVKIKSLKERVNIKKLIMLPLKNKEFMRYTVRLGFFYLFLYIGASFSQLYMIKYFNLSYTYINLMGSLSAILQVLIFYKFWGRINDKLGSKFVMMTSMWFYAIDMFIWFLMTTQNVYFLLPCGHIMGAIEGTGFATGTFTRRYEIIPEEGRPIYDAFFSGFIGIVLLISPIIGNILRNFFGSIEWIMKIEYGNFKAVYLISSLSIIVLQVINMINIKRTDKANRCLQRESYLEAFDALKEIVVIRR